MRTVLKIVGITAGVLSLVFVGLLVAMRSHTPAITATGSAGSIAVLEPVVLGEQEQYIAIRGSDRTNPVLLFLHGGPGMPMMYLSHAFQRELEHHFVVVQWDQRGAGKSFREDVPVETLNVEQLVSDALELVNLLQKRLDCGRVYLAGHSWGSYLGMIVVSRRPKLFSAYVGIGQVAHGERTREIQEAFIRREASKTGELEAIDDLDAYGESAHEKWLFRFHGELVDHTSWLPFFKTGLRSPEYGFFDFFKIAPGSNFSSRHMEYNAIDGELMEEITRVDIPVYFFMGKHDYVTPFELAREYLDLLDAPYKKMVWFENSAHFPFYEEPEKFAEAMIIVLKEAVEQ